MNPNYSSSSSLEKANYLLIHKEYSHNLKAKGMY
jgi:hypothetical protein